MLANLSYSGSWMLEIIEKNSQEIVLWYWPYFLKNSRQKYPIYLKIRRYYQNKKNHLI